MAGVILVSDLHQTDNPRDEYRWGLFKWLEEQADKLRADNIICLGDLTDNKNYHPAMLVNRLVNSMNPGWVLLKGNHDYTDPDCPFFGFLDRMGLFYITNPRVLRLDIGRCLFLPSTRNWQRDWEALDFSDNIDYIFLHATVDGAIGENGHELPGVPQSAFRTFKGKQIWSGDIHVPQVLGKINYVGAPYHIRFGDTFTPRAVFLDKDGKQIDLHYPCLKKHTLRLTSEMKMPKVLPRQGDQVKIEVSLKRSENPMWPELRDRLRAQAAEMGWSVHGMQPVWLPDEKVPGVPSAELVGRQTPIERVRQFCTDRDLPKDVADVGLKLVS